MLALVKVDAAEARKGLVDEKNAAGGIDPTRHNGMHYYR